MQNCDEGLPSIVLAGRGLLLKCSYLLNRALYSNQILQTVIQISYPCHASTLNTGYKTEIQTGKVYFANVDRCKTTYSFYF